MAKHVYFVRHGESDSNADGVVRGDKAMLSEKGKVQADIVAKRMRNIEIDALISSPFPRTLDTASAISRELNLPIEQNELFVERKRPIEAIGGNWKEDGIKKIQRDIFDGYALEMHRYSDEENFEDLRTRANAAWEFLVAHPKDKICVVTHGIFLRVLLCAAVQGSEFSGKDLQNFIRSTEPDNTGISYFAFQEDNFSHVPKMQWNVKSWNDLTHLG